MKGLVRSMLAVGAIVLVAVAGAHPCPEDTEPGTLDAFVRPGSEELGKVASMRSARVTVTTEDGTVVSQGEGDLSDLHRFKLPPGRYVLRVDGDGLRTVNKAGIVVIANKTTETMTFVTSE